jgi:hypothetical protein
MMLQFDWCIEGYQTMGRKSENSGAIAERMFLHNPPFSGAGYRIAKRSQSPYAGAPKHEHSVYFFWWAFLCCEPNYKKFCERGGKGRGSRKFRKIYNDFGNVHDLTFEAWWQQRGVELFAEPVGREVRRLAPNERATRDPEVAVLSIPLSLSLRKINSWVEQLLRDELLQQQSSKARYPVASRPMLQSLHKTLSIHKLRKERLDIHLYEIANLSQIQNANLRNDVMAQRRWQTNEVSRYLRQAEYLMENVVQGIFPLSKPRSSVV